MINLTSLRQEYREKPLRREDLHDNPFREFEQWFNLANDSGILEPNAMSLCTISPEGKPHIRTVLLKLYDENGFVFFSNYQSQKAKDIAANPNVALHFVWLALQRQLRIEGIIEKISTAESLSYFLSRPRGSQLGAWASHQSEIVNSRSIIEAKFHEVKTKFLHGEVPLPDFWGGYRVKPTLFEFWQGGKDRLHDRFIYTPQTHAKWEINRIAP
ncbi:MAG: pyridoxamine 5'-phosphate oxidase [Sulfurospirillaceae bacterium]|nr:pyridoxamine 5'-phosphate oxidase [Sulfurospirillaceae bacterium]MDD2826201.1 pyridoxamine 5'-phosphate oxidase [Sulfurospirillaceae bacterium]